MFLIADAGFLDTAKSSLFGNFGPAIAMLLGVVLLIYGVVKIAQGIMTQQSRGSHLAWGGIAFVVGAFLATGSVMSFVQNQGSGTAKSLGLN